MTFDAGLVVGAIVAVGVEVGFGIEVGVGDGVRAGTGVCLSTGMGLGVGVGIGVFSGLIGGWRRSKAMRALRGADDFGYRFAMFETQSRASSVRPNFSPASRTAS